MSKKQRYGAFRKKDFRCVVEYTIDYLCHKFGYKRKPYVRETQLPTNAIMYYVHRDKKCAIYYDYNQFKRVFGDGDFDEQEAIAAGIAAHETRHYYQHRQMTAKNPIEKKEIVERWRENENNPTEVTDKRLDEYCLQALELDAFLFEYLFVAETFDVVMLSALRDEKHLNALEKLYIEYFGETEEELFGEKVRAYLRKRNSTT